MSGTYSLALKNAILAACKTAIDGGFLFLFAGAPPAGAGDELDMTSVHTQIGKISVGDDGVTGLTFAAPAGGVMQKNPSENWICTTSFDGSQSGESTLTPTFFRLCTASDNGRGPANETTGHRVQGTLSGPGGGGDVVLAAATISNNVAQGIGEFYLDVP